MNLQLFNSFKKSGTTTLIMAIVSLGFVTAIAYSIVKKQLPTKTSLPTSSQNQNLPQAIAALGYLEPQGEVIQLSAPAFMEGARVKKLLVNRGQQINAGQIIAILDNSDRLTAILEEAKTNVKVANARLQQIKAGAKQGEITAQKSKFQATQAELQGQITTQKATIASLKYDLEGQKNTQKAVIQRIESELKNAQTECSRYENLYTDGAVSTSQKDNICLQKEIKENQLKEAKSTLNQVITTKQEQINQATANLNRTINTVSRQINQEKATLAAVSEVRPTDVILANTQLEAAQKAVKTAQANLDLSYVRSPQNGQIIKIHTWPGELISNKGIVAIGNTQQMYVTTEIYETDINKVKLGQIATIKADGIVEGLTGIVDEIGLEISSKNVLSTDPVADADARVVEVKIKLNPQDSIKVSRLTNLQVNVIINPGKTDN
ncbi:ABC exporter membrane fusion protein [Dolichospermum sp. UHCC 0684]|uniref:ABC exporter membrane fusion protein n=1 Tax=unclassified Dolichospermum TaxID=2622029 RepID=UPI001446AC96|nr:MULTISPECIES: ABC exporter membrane fusion protein [unclassified Dolichospermum]MEA5529053.1 ABC exporter membrane fusion protein [Dolichospermum sp. UHCC 0684]MTJ35041.1 biotin/lipoyl-binding protein [Dolichospermum sp. UHCC 0260]